MADVVIAADASLALSDERAFVERVSGPTRFWDTYSSLLTATDCEQVDLRAYREGSSWYLGTGGMDRTEIDGVSLGRSYEWAATTELVRLYRAQRVLARLTEGRSGATVQLRGVTREWAYAAHALGHRVAGQQGIVAGPLPGTRIRRPAWYARSAGRLVSLRGSPARVGLVYARSWAIAHGRALASRWPLMTIEPGPKYLVAMLRSGRWMQIGWLHGATGGTGASAAGELAVEHPYLGDLWRSAATDMLDAARLGQRVAERLPVLVACQDALPPERALLLGARSAGARIITLEHGISGGFLDQIATISQVLGVWGPPHVAYHRPLAPPSTAVEVIGWPRLADAVGIRRRHSSWDVVFFAQPTHDLGAGSWPEDPLHALEVVERYAAAHPRRRVGVKFHPSTKDFGWEPHALRHSKRVHGDSLAVLRSCRAAVVSLSTTGIEAMALGVPVVQLAMRGTLGGVNFIAQSGAPTAHTAEELAEELDRILDDPREYRRAAETGTEYARHFIAGLNEPGSASLRLIAVVESLLAEAGERPE